MSGDTGYIFQFNREEMVIAYGMARLQNAVPINLALAGTPVGTDRLSRG
jgi:hypothetical protein